MGFKRLTDHQLIRVLDLAEQGASQTAIAADIGASQQAVSRALRVIRDDLEASELPAGSARPAGLTARPRGSARNSPPAADQGRTHGTPQGDFERGASAPNRRSF